VVVVAHSNTIRSLMAYFDEVRARARARARARGRVRV